MYKDGDVDRRLRDAKDFRSFFELRNGREYVPIYGEMITQWYEMLNDTIADYVDLKLGIK